MRLRDIDRIVGAEIRYGRRRLNMPAEDLAAALNIPAVLLSLYEAGVVRVSALQLWRISTVLRRPVSHFFPLSDIP